MHVNVHNICTGGVVFCGCIFYFYFVFFYFSFFVRGLFGLCFWWLKIHRRMVGRNPEIRALCVGVRIYGDVWQSGTLEAFNMRPLGAWIG